MYFAYSIVALLMCTTAAAQAPSSAAPLDLALPAASAPSQASTVAQPSSDPAPASTSDAAPISEPYDTTYGDRRDAAQEACDDKTYSQPELHGNVGMGVAASKHADANYETAELTASKALGSCDDPKGDVSASIRVTKSNVNFRRGRGP